MSVETFIVPTPKSALLQYKGKPVPWVTRWSGEVNADKISVGLGRDGHLLVSYADGRENREGSGVLWKREGITRSGQPQFSQVNTYRQRASMAKRLCQICGSKINERPIQWLLSKKQFDIEDDGSATTMSSPTCASCVPLSLELCPHLLREGYLLLNVLEYEIWGVYGQVALYRDGSIKQVGGKVPYRDSNIPLTSVVAYQLIARLTKYVVKEEK